MLIETELGRIQIAPLAIAGLAARSVLQSYGVVGMALPSLRDGIAELLTGDSSRRGVVISAENGTVGIDLYVILQYGLRISEVANNIMRSVKFTVEQALGQPISHVNVHVQGLRVSKNDD